MKHLSKEEFRKRLINFNKRLTQALEVAGEELLEKNNSRVGFYELGMAGGKVEALEEIKKDFAEEFGLDQD